MSLDMLLLWLGCFSFGKETLLYAVSVKFMSLDMLWLSSFSFGKSFLCWLTAIHEDTGRSLTNIQMQFGKNTPSCR